MSDFTFELVTENLKNEVNFSWSRWGDGEWNAVLGVKGKNTDGHEYFPDMGSRLKQILISKPSYYLGIQRIAKEQNKGSNEFNRLVALNDWVDNEIIHRASIKGRLHELFEALEDRRVIIVANEHVCKFPFRFDGTVVISESNCWLKYESVKSRIKQVITDNCVILYCASMMTNVLIDDFSHMNITQIDMGSSLDPYVNRITRSYHKNLKK